MRRDSGLNVVVGLREGSASKAKAEQAGLKVVSIEEATQTAAAQTFIERWQGVTASELSTAQSFVIELCALLGAAPPHPTPAQDYMFERPVTFQHGNGSTSSGRRRLPPAEVI